MNKKRKYEPKEWSWTSKLYNASALAEKATEQAEQVEYLNARIASVQRAYEAKVEETTLLNEDLRKWSTSYDSLREDLQESKKLSASLIAESETFKTNMDALRASCEENEEKIALQDEELTDNRTESETFKTNLGALRASCEENKEKIALQGEELTDNRAELADKNAEIASLQKELHRTKRECDENRARKKSWKKKYEELAHMGAAALAKITKESYGVSPQQFEAYKRIAATQFQVDKAHDQREEALKLLHANVNALEDQRE